MKMQSMWSLWILIISISAIPYIHGQVRFQDQGPQECLSYPTELIGSCVPINECPSLNKVFVQAKAGQADALTILRRSVCSAGSSGRLNVCCPPKNSVPSGGSFPERCGGKNHTQRIVGGDNAQLTQWPWMAILRASGGDFGGSWICGGVLISARYVLTAAHCVEDPRFTLDFVRLGELVLNQNPDRGGSLIAPTPQDKSVEKIISHPEYKKPCPRCNDIALLKLASPARLDKVFVEPICISKNPIKDIGYTPGHSSNQRAWVAGWGTSIANPFVFSQANHLQHLQVPLLELSFCQERRKVYPDPNMIFCAGGVAGKDTCRGDSGGPLMLAAESHEWYSIGIVSFGNTFCGAAGSQSVFTNVNYYLPWIEANLL